MRHLNKTVKTDNHSIVKCSVKEPTRVAVCADAIAKKHFPNCEMLDINQCLAEHNAVENLQKSIQNMYKNIALTTNKNPKLRLSAEIIRLPYNSRINDAITAGEKIYAYGDDAQDYLDKIRGRLNSTALQIILKNMRTLQLLYHELYPDAKQLSQDLQFDSLTKDSFKLDAQKKAPLHSTLNKYAKQIQDKLDGKTATYNLSNQYNKKNAVIFHNRIFYFTPQEPSSWFSFPPAPVFPLPLK